MKFYSSFWLLFFFYFFQQSSIAQSRKDSLLNVLATLKESKKKAEINILLAQESMSVNYREALRFSQDAAFLAQQEREPTLLMEAYKNIASVFFYMGVYDQALLYFERCAAEAGKAGKIFDQLNAQTNQALIHGAIGQHQQAIDLLKKGKPQLEQAYLLAKQPMPLSDQVSLYLNIAYNYTELKQAKFAHPFLDSALFLASKDKPELRIVRAKLLQTKARALLLEGRTEEVQPYISEAEKIVSDLSDRTSELTIKGLQGKMQELNGKPLSAISTYRMGFTGADAIGSLLLKRFFAGELARVYQESGNADSALHYIQLGKDLEKIASDQNARDDLARKELMDQFAKREQELESSRDTLRRRYLITIGILGAILGFFVLGYQKYRRKYQQAALRQLKIELESEQLELDRKQLETRVADQEKLLTELEFKLSKNALLQSVVGELQTLAKGKPATGQNISELNGKIWAEFDIRFLQTHAGFYERLLKSCPGLTTNERRLCAFLLLDMSTKEISVITGQSVRSIEIARTRLRKKLNLTQSDTSLFEYLSAL
jgi:hypothetical protein